MLSPLPLCIKAVRGALDHCLRLQRQKSRRIRSHPAPTRDRNRRQQPRQVRAVPAVPGPSTALSSRGVGMPFVSEDPSSPVEVRRAETPNYLARRHTDSAFVWIKAQKRARYYSSIEYQARPLERKSPTREIAAAPSNC
jgi:hypothetical protein